MQHDDGRKPLMQIGALLVTIAAVLGTVAAGIALAVGSLPPEFDAFAQHLAFVGPLAAAICLGLTAIGKGLYQIGKQGVDVEEPGAGETISDPGDSFGRVSTGGAYNDVATDLEAVDAEVER